MRERRVYIKYGAQEAELLGHVMVGELDAVIVVGGTENDDVRRRL